MPVLAQGSTSNEHGGVDVSWISEGSSKQETDFNLEEIKLTPHELARDEITAMFDVTPRQIRRYVEPLTDLGVLVSATTRAPYHLAFPARLAPQWLPGLFPAQTP